MLIKKLSQGEIQVINDSDGDEIREVLTAAFPNDKWVADHNFTNGFFYRLNWSGHCCTYGRFADPNLPTHSVKELYAELHPELTVKKAAEWQPKWGEEVEVSDNGISWLPALFVGKHPRKDSYVTAYDGCADWKHIRPLSTLSLTLEEIAKKFGVQKVEIVKSKA